MKLSIVPSDDCVCENDVCQLHLSWDGTPPDIHALQWQDVSGWIEYNDGKPNEDITVLPDWAYNAMAAWDVANNPVKLPPTADENKTIARSKLEGTDWTQIPSVSDPALSNPYLANKFEFDQYRNTIRQIVLNPVAGNIDWATEPQTIWQTV
jgi:hypothetical protein